MTIGPGYDMAGRKVAAVVADLTSAGAPEEDAKKLAAGAEVKRGPDSQRWVTDNVEKLPKISVEVSIALFERIYPIYLRSAQDQVKSWTGDPARWASYPQQMRDVLVDLMYRGDLAPKHQAKLLPSLSASSYSEFRRAILDVPYWRKVPTLKDSKKGEPNERITKRVRWLPEDPAHPDVTTLPIAGLPHVFLRTRLSTPVDPLPPSVPVHRVIEGVVLVNEADPNRRVWLPVPLGEALLERALRFDAGASAHKLRPGFELFVPLLDRTLLALVLRAPEGGPANPLPTLEGTLIGPKPAPAIEPVDGWPAFQTDASKAVFRDGPVLDLEDFQIRTFPLYPGQADVGLDNAALSVHLEDTRSTLRAVRRNPASPVSASVQSSLVYRNRASAGFSEDIAVPLRPAAPFTALPGAASAGTARFLKLDVSDADSSGKLDLLASPRPPNPGDSMEPMRDWLPQVSLSDTLRQLKATLREAALPVPAGDIFSGASPIQFLGLSLVPGSKDPLPVELDGDDLTIGNLSAKIKLNDGSQLDLSGGVLRLTRDLVVATDRGAPTLDFTLRGDRALLASDKSPFSIRILDGTRVRLSLDPGGPTLLLSRDGGRVAEIAVPGIASFTDPNLNTRFLFDVAGHEEIDPSDLPPGAVPKVCRLSSGGAEIRADVRPGPIGLPIVRNGRVLEGSVAVASGDVYIRAKATADLPYFERATGTMEVAASSVSGLKIGARFDVKIDKEWTDPSGVLSVRSPSAWVDVQWASGAGAGNSPWTVNGGVGGTLVFRPPAAFGEGAAADWLSGLFSGLEITFDNLALRDLASPKALEEGLSLKLKIARPVTFSLWEILRTTIDEIRLWGKGISIGGDFEASLPGVATLSGRLPLLGIRLDAGKVHLGLDKAPRDFSMRGQLTLASGVRAALSFVRDDVSVAGSGALSIPGLPEIKVLCRLGRSSIGKVLLALYFSVDVPITVFPGITLRKWGAGVGINEVLQGVEEVAQGYAEKVLSGKVAMPNPGSLESWLHRGEGDDEHAMLAMQTYLCASSAAGSDDSMPQPYLANAVLTLSDDGTVALFTNLWLFTSFLDAETQAFRGAPLARGVAVLSPRHKRLEARYVTLTGSKMSRELPILTSALDAVRTEATLIVSPDLFRFKLGPTRANLTILGIHFSGQSLFLVERRRGTLVIGYRVALAASFSESIGVSFALVEASVRLSASFAFDAVFVATAEWVGKKGAGLSLYGRARVDVAASLEIELKIGFRITIKIWRWKKTIEIYKRFTASLSLVFNAEIRALIGVSPAFSARGTIEVRLFGVTLRLSAGVKIGDMAALDTAETALVDYLGLG